MKIINRNTSEVLTKREIGKKSIPTPVIDTSDIQLEKKTHYVPSVQNLEKERVKEDNIVKEIIVYPKERCSHINSEGKRCTRLAVGEWDVCEKHGGDPVIVQNLFKGDEIPDILRGKKYDPKFHPMEFLVLAKEGMSIVEIAAEFEVPVRELKTWSETYVEFNKAFEIGEALHEAWYLAEGKRNLDNRGYNVELFKFITGNKLGWSTKTESKNLNVHAGVLLIPKKKTEAEWEAEHGAQDADYTVVD